MKFVRFSTLVAICVTCMASSCSAADNPSAFVVPKIVWPAPAAITYGTALSSTQLNARANLLGTFRYSPASGTVLSAGAHILNAAFTPINLNKGRVAAATSTVSITVSKATPKINWNTPAPVLVGTALSSTQLNAAASFNGKTLPGKYVYEPAAGTVLNAAGTQKLSVTFTPADTADFNSATATVSLTVNPWTDNPAYSWTNVRIVAGGYIPGVYFHPTQPNLMYARTDIGGAYRWGPNDKQWVPLLDFLSKDQGSWTGVEAIGLDPNDPNKLYIAGGMYDASWAGNCGMLISTDQGATFKTVPLNFQCGSNEPGRGAGDRIAVDPNRPGTLYFGTRDAGLQISTDSGLTWNPVSGLKVVSSVPGDWGTISNGVVSVMPVKSSGSRGSATPVVYAAVAGTGLNGNSQGFYVSTNAGSASSTWTAVEGQPSLTGASQNISETIDGVVKKFSLAPLQAKIGADGSIYILYGDMTGPGSMNISQLWKFVPGANWTSGKWTQITLPNSAAGGVENYTPDGILYNGYGGLAVDPSHAGHLLLGTMDQYWPTGDVVYRSTDDGKTWRDVTSVNAGGQSRSPNLATHDNTIAPYFGPPGTVSTGNWPTGIAIDPFNPDHAMYTFGGGLWITQNLTDSDPSASSKGIIHWKLDDLGIEETAILGLWAPPSGKTILLSAIGDVYGFAHQDLTVSPPQGNYTNPGATPSSMDFVQKTPTTVVRVVNGQWGAKPPGTISTDGGLTWTGFASMPAGTQGGGQIAIAPDGSSMVWATQDTSSVWYSKDGGKTWNASIGISPQSQVVSDRVKPGVYYGFLNGTLTISTDGGATFATIQTGLPTAPSWAVQPILYVLPDAQGDVWLTAGGGGSGLYSNTGARTSPQLTPISSVATAYHLGFGKAAPGHSKLTLFLDGTIGTQWGLYRSTDGGSTWLRINDDAHQWGGIGLVCGDMRTFGTVYLGARGIIWGTSTY